MITYINSANANRYSRLFSEAEDALKRARIAQGASIEGMFGREITDPETNETYYEKGITSLNTYFAWIKDLLEIERVAVLDEDGEWAVDENGNRITEDLDGLRFAMLPIDEEVFKINADTRNITVPKPFDTIGLGVQGDEIAEIVYFKVDRFYDATDLFNQKIMIEWIAPEYTDKNGKKVALKGYSVPTVKILDESSEYVIFGWALASQITEHPGKVTFAVRFFKVSDDGDIQYSLSTLPATATIKAGIGLDIPKLLKNEGGLEGYTVLDDKIKILIKERAENSSFGAGDTAHEPEIYELYVDPDNSAKPYVVVLEQREVEEGVFEWQATVNGCGFSDDAGDITYFWKKFDYFTGERIPPAEGSSFAYHAVYKPMTLTDAIALHAAQPAIKLYTKLPGAVEAYKICDDLAQLQIDDPTAIIYRNDSTCIFDAVGTYRLAVKNRRGNHSATTDSDPIIVYPPAVPQDITITEDCLLGDDNTAELKVEFVIPSEPDVDPRIREYRDDEGEILAKYAFDPANEDPEFVWYFKGLGDAEAAAIENSDDDELIADAEGDYYCKIRGALNGEKSEYAQSEVCRVTYPPVVPIVTIEGTDPMAGNGKKSLATDKGFVIPALADDKKELPVKEAIAEYVISVGGVAPLEIKLTGLNGAATHPLTDEIYYQWYEYTIDKTNNASALPYGDDVFEAYKGIYEPAAKNIRWLADEAVSEKVLFDRTVEGAKITYTPNKDGWYFCVITNIYNGYTSQTCSPLAKYDSSIDN